MSTTSTAPNGSDSTLGNGTVLKAKNVSETQLFRALQGLATALEAGIGVRGLLDHPAAVSDYPREVVSAMRAAADQGRPLSETLYETGLLMPQDHAILQAAERVGSVHEGLTAVADAVQSRIRARRSLLAGLAYPVLLIVAASVILPLPLCFTAGFGAYAVRAFLVPFATVIGFAVLFWWLPRLPPNDVRRRWPRRVARTIPGFAGAAKLADLSDYFSIAGHALGAGLTVDEAFTSASQAVERSGLRKARAQMLQRLRKGDRLADAMQATGAFDAEAIGRIAQAEHIGDVPDAMVALSATYDERAKRRLKRTMVVVVAACYALAVLFVAYRIVNGFIGVLDTVEQSLEFE